MSDPRDYEPYDDQGVRLPRRTIGDNKPPSPTEEFQPRVNRLLAELTRLIAQPVTERSAAQLRDVVARAIALKKAMDDAKARDKQPANDELKRIEAAYRPLVDDTERVRTEARAKIDAFLRAEEERRQREAREARLAAQAEADRAAKAKAEAKENPFAAAAADDAVYDATMADIGATHAERRAEAGPAVVSAAGLGRATSLRSYWSVKVVDAEALVRHFANDRDVIAAATKVANAMARATKGAQPIPGCELVEDRRSA